MNKRPLDKSKKSNIKCEHCAFWAHNAWFRSLGCTCLDSPKYKQPTNYWIRCKHFKWKEGEQMRPIDVDSLTDIYTIYDDYGDKHTVIDASDIADAPTLNAIVIPENATNGDMIKAMFPNMQFNIVDELVWTNVDGQSTRFLTEWWNAPYKGTQS